MGQGWGLKGGQGRDRAGAGTTCNSWSRGGFRIEMGWGWGRDQGDRKVRESGSAQARAAEKAV